MAKPLPIICTKSNNGTVSYGTSRYLYHREDGPALIIPNQSEQWYYHNKRHREDGPALVYAEGRQEWWINNKRHREDGPATIEPNGYHLFFLEGISYDEDKYYSALNRYKAIKIQSKLEKFADSYSTSAKKKEAGEALISFLVGDCKHSFIKNNICELCSLTDSKGTKK